MAGEEEKIESAVFRLFTYAVLVMSLVICLIFSFVGNLQEQAQNSVSIAALCVALSLIIAIIRDTILSRALHLSDFQILSFCVFSIFFVADFSNLNSERKSLFIQEPAFWILSLPTVKFLLDLTWFLSPSIIKLAIKKALQSLSNKIKNFLYSIGNFLKAPLIFLLSSILVVFSLIVGAVILVKSVSFLESVAAAPSWALVIIGLLVAILYTLWNTEKR